MGYKISEFSAISGLTTSNIRYYEERGFPAAKRSESGYREYQFEDSYRINTFNALLAHGFSVSEAVALLHAHPARQLAGHLEQKNLEIEEQIQMLHKKKEWNRVVQDVMNRLDEEMKKTHEVSLPDLCYLICTDGFDHAPSLEHGDLMADWVDALPVSHYAGRVWSDGRFTLGMLMELSEAKERGLDRPGTEIIPGGVFRALLLPGTDPSELTEDPRIRELRKNNAILPDCSFQIYLMLDTEEFGADINFCFFREP